jgi:hypothetical protein
MRRARCVTRWVLMRGWYRRERRETACVARMVDRVHASESVPVHGWHRRLGGSEEQPLLPTDLKDPVRHARWPRERHASAANSADRGKTRTEDP